ncbi:MAG: outer membrane beta-barrel protein [Candidatus Cryptobacteroides sp.]
MKPDMEIYDRMKMTKLKIMTAAICGVIGMATASAQVAVRADFNGMYYYSITPAESQIGIAPGVGVQLGADYDMHVKGTFYVTPGLNWSYRAVVSSNFSGSDSGSEVIQEHFLNVPLHAKWKFDIKPDKFGMYLYCGPVFSVGLASRSRFSLDISDVTIDGTYDYFKKEIDFTLVGLGYDNIYDYLRETLEAAGLGFRRFDIRLDLGTGFVFKRNNELVFGVDIGTFNRYDNNLPEKSYMDSCNFYIGYRYRFGKKQQ